MNIKLPRMLFGDELTKALSVYPPYSPEILKEGPAERLLALSSIYDVFIPSAATAEIYTKLYLACHRALEKKGSVTEVRQYGENRRRMMQMESHGIMGGSDSFSILAPSGYGKTTSISRAVSVISHNQILTLNKPTRRIIPVLSVECPHDCSLKALLYSILRGVDAHLGSEYYTDAVRSRATVDQLIGAVSSVAMANLGLVVLDETQNVLYHKNGAGLVHGITEIINHSGISIALVGTPDAAVFLEKAQQLARRSLGLQYERLVYDDYFHKLCTELLSYRYVREPIEVNEGIIEYLYGHSGGLVANVVFLVHDAQEIAILSRHEELDIESLRLAFKNRLAMLHGFIPDVSPRAVTMPKLTRSSLPKTPEQTNDIGKEDLIESLAAEAKQSNMDIVAALREHFPVWELRL